MPIYENAEMSPKESIMLQAQQEEARLAREHAITMKQMELAIKKEENAAKIELRRLESKWASWLKIPVLVVKLPLYLTMGLAYCIATARKYDPPKRFWDLLS